MLPLTRIVLTAMAVLCTAMVLIGGLCASGTGPCYALLGHSDVVVGTPLVVLGSVAMGAPLLAIGSAALVAALSALFGVGGNRGAVDGGGADRATAGTPLLAASGGGSVQSPPATAPPSKALAEIRSFMYASHFLSSWGDRMWQFAVPLLFMEIFVDTLLPSALFSLLLYLGCTLCMTSAGRWVDRAPRMVLVSSARCVPVVVVHSVTRVYDFSFLIVVLHRHSSNGKSQTSRT